MLIAWSVCLLYLAVFAFHQAGQRRTAFAGLKTSAPKRQAVRLSGWALAAIALVVLAWPQGWERGVPVWLAAFMLSAFSCLLVGSLMPKRHAQSAVVALVLCIGLGIIVLIGGQP